MSSSGKKIETYEGVEEVLVKEGHKKKKSKKRMIVEDRLTTSLDKITKYNGFDWEYDMKNMVEELNFVIEAMARTLGCYAKVSLMQVVLVSKSSKIQEKCMMIVHKFLMNEYASAQEEAEALNKIMDFKKEHMELIMDARAKLIKRTHHEMENDKGKKRQRKLKKLAEEENNIIDDKKQLVEKLQEELGKINEEASGELLKVVQMYRRIRQPVFEKRTNIIKCIPGFWSTVFMRHHVLGKLVCSEEEDSKIFEFLISIQVEESEDVKSGYTITFNFNPNHYFENTKLLKTYTFLEDDGLTKITASSIRWTEEGKGVVSEKSFFRWFSEVNQRDEVGEIIKDELWPNPLVCFSIESDKEGVDDEVVKYSDDEEDLQDSEDEDDLLVVKDSEDE